ncbi:MAG: hypothetical protein QM528_03645 [Phycisphaerales bacterium]|nr:hypothetical protein [Phycisphaerales bacterium]
MKTQYQNIGNILSRKDMQASELKKITGASGKDSCNGGGNGFSCKANDGKGYWCVIVRHQAILEDGSTVYGCVVGNDAGYCPAGACNLDSGLPEATCIGRNADGRYRRC